MKESAQGVATRVSPRRSQRGVAAKGQEKGGVPEEEQTAEPDETVETEMKEKEGGAATVNEEQAVKAKNEDSGGARTVGIEHPPVGSSHRYKQTAKRRRSNEVTASERAATQKRLDRGFEDTEDADEEEEESDEEDEEEEGEAQGRGGGDANMLFMDSQVRDSLFAFISSLLCLSSSHWRSEFDVDQEGRATCRESRSANIPVWGSPIGCRLVD